MNSGAVEEAVQLASCLDPHLACVAARGWGLLEEVRPDDVMGVVLWMWLLQQVCDLCAECVEEGEEWAVQVMREVVMGCSDTQLVQNCQKWKVKLVAAVQVKNTELHTLVFCLFFNQRCSGATVLRLLCLITAALVSRAHHSPSAVRDFSTTYLPPLLSPLLRYQESAPPLQSAVLPCLSTIHHLYPGACKPHRVSSHH